MSLPEIYKEFLTVFENLRNFQNIENFLSLYSLMEISTKYEFS
jgi:hypothetical protein